MDIKTTRKCKFCHKQIVLEDKKSVLFKKAYFHDDCFVTKLTTAKRKAVSEEVALEISRQLKILCEPIVKDIIIKNHLYKWLQQSYDVVVIPNYFFQKMEDVFQGNYKGLSEKISPEDVYYIWRKRKSEYDKTNDYQRTRGKIIEGIGRLSYDLAIVVSQYDSYKKWKEKQKVDKKIIGELIGQEKIDYDKIFVKPDREDDYIIDDNEEECKINE